MDKLLDDTEVLPLKGGTDIAEAPKDAEHSAAVAEQTAISLALAQVEARQRFGRSLQNLKH